VENEVGKKMEEVRNKKVKLESKTADEVNVSTHIRSFRFVYGLLAAGYFGCVILQVFFAGLGIFVNYSELDLHRTFANYFENFSLLMFLVTFFGRIWGGLRWYTLSLFVLTTLQHMTVRVFSGPFRALHTIDALLLFGISLYLMRRSWPWLMLRTESIVNKEKK
jgi:hypothetical protein